MACPKIMLYVTYTAILLRTILDEAVNTRISRFKSRFVQQRTLLTVPTELFE